MSYTAKHIATDHKDLIHDVSYDFYGKRMATCSSDQSVKVVIQLMLRCLLNFEPLAGVGPERW